MKRIFIRLGIAALAVALLVTGLIFATSADGTTPQETYTSIDPVKKTVTLEAPFANKVTFRNEDGSYITDEDGNIYGNLE